MTAVPRVFVKVGAEGVFVAAVQHARIGICVKIDDGASRASEITLIAVLFKLPDDVWTEDEKIHLRQLADVKLYNWNKIQIGVVRSLLLE